MKLYNSLSKKLEKFIPIKKKEVKIYTCGPTVYNYAHLGNFFAYLTADTLYRWLKFGENYKVKWVLNITDLEDKTIRDSLLAYPALAPAKALKKHCDFYLKAFLKDLERLNIKKSSFTAMPRVTENIEIQKDLVEKIYKNGYAYIADNSVYFNLKKYQENYKYGKLINLEKTTITKNRVDSDEYEKQESADFVLWKGKKDNEPYWDFKLNNSYLPGRPGWHLECSALEHHFLGLPFDIHTGGVDLLFPHHENEIAQTCAGYQVEPTKYWVHNGYLQVEGAKMSKSANNFFTLKDLIEKEKLSAEAIRLAVVTNHYKNNFNFTKNGLHAAEKHLQEVRELYKKLLENKNKNKTSPFDPQFINDFSEALQNNLNTPQAFKIFLDFIKKTKQNFLQINYQKSLNFINFVGNIFGVDFSYQEIEIPKKVVDLAEQRKKAKKQKDFTLADQLRAEISDLGFVVVDLREGYEIKVLNK